MREVIKNSAVVIALAASAAIVMTNPRKLPKRPLEALPVALPAPTPYTAADTIVAKLLHSECYLYDEDDMYRVAAVVYNRVRDDRFPPTVRGVIFRKNQFSGIHTDRFRSPAKRIALEVAREVRLGNFPFDPEIVGYHNASIATDRDWVDSVADRVRLVGNHHRFHTL